jgi:hypothetical protein
MRICTALATFSLIVSSANANTFECLVDAVTFGINSTDYPDGIIFQAFTFFEDDNWPEIMCYTNGNFDPSNCDAGVTDTFLSIASACDTLNGLLIPTVLTLCAEQIFPPGTSSIETFPDLTMKNIPVCVPPTCPSDTNFFELMKNFVDVLDEESTRFLDDSLCLSPTPSPTKAPTTSKASSVDSSLIASGLTMLGIVLFAI